MLELVDCYHLRSLKGLEHLHGAVRYDMSPRGDLCSDWWMEIRWAFQMALDLEVRAETWGCVSA